MFVCNVCLKHFSSKQKLNEHIHRYNECYVVRLKEEHSKEIEKIKNELKGIHSEEVQRLQDKIDSLTQQLIDKPTVINNVQKVEVNMTKDEYLKSKRGICLSLDGILADKKWKEKLDKIINNGRLNKYKDYNYYMLIEGICGKGTIQDNIVIVNERQIKVQIKWFGTVDILGLRQYPYNMYVDMKEINDYIRCQVDEKNKKHILNNDEYMNGLRYKIREHCNNQTWKGIKDRMVVENKLL